MTIQMFLWWLLPGMFSGIWLLTLLLDDEIKKVTLGDIVKGIFILMVMSVLSWVSVFIVIGITWNEKKLGDIILWKKLKGSK